MDTVFYIEVGAMERKTFITPAGLEETLKAVGENIKLARLRRRITSSLLAERAGVSRVTLRKVEQGNSRVAMGIYANVLFCLGLEADLLHLAGEDPLGRRLQDAGLTHTRMRVPKKRG